MKVWFKYARREWLQTIRHPAEWLNPILFFALIGVLFPLSNIASPALLHAMGAGVIWVAALLANALVFTRLFDHDDESGVLEQYMVSEHALSVIVMIKVVTNWVLFILPLLVLVPLIALAYGLSVSEIAVLLLGLVLGTPSLALLAAMISALTLSLRSSSVLLGLILFPLYIPVLIFATGSVSAVANGGAYLPEIALLVAILLLCSWCCPWCCARLLRMTLEYR